MEQMVYAWKVNHRMRWRNSGNISDCICGWNARHFRRRRQLQSALSHRLSWQKYHLFAVIDWQWERKFPAGPRIQTLTTLQPAVWVWGNTVSECNFPQSRIMASFLRLSGWVQIVLDYLMLAKSEIKLDFYVVSVSCYQNILPPGTYNRITSAAVSRALPRGLLTILYNL